MRVTRFTADTADGAVDIHYRGDGEVYRVAGFDPPSQEFRQAQIAIPPIVTGMLYIDLDTGLKRITWSDNNNVSEFRIELQSLVGGGEGALKIVSPKYSWHVDPETGDVTPINCPGELVAAVREFREQCRRYAQGHRAQGELSFSLSMPDEGSL